MRIGLVMSEYPSARGHGGLATYTYTLANALARLGHTITLFLRAGVSADPLDPAVRQRILEPRKTRGLCPALTRLLFPEIAHERDCSSGLFAELLSLRADEGLDIVQVPEYNGLAVSFRNAPFPLILRFHTPAYFVDQLNGISPGSRRCRWYGHEQAALRNARGFTVSSEALKKEVCRHYLLDPDRVTVIRNPVDCETFSPADARPSGPLRLLFVGRLERRKGLDRLLPCVGALLRKNENLVFTFAGKDQGGEAGAYREALIRAAGPFSGRLEFRGEVTRSELPALYRSSDIFVLPSLFDNSPNALFEAMASGLACVGSDTGGVNEMITEGETGLLFAPENSQDLINKIERFINHADVRRELGDAARKFIMEKHPPGVIARETVDFYNRFLS